MEETVACWARTGTSGEVVAGALEGPRHLGVPLNDLLLKGTGVSALDLISLRPSNEKLKRGKSPDARLRHDGLALNAVVLQHLRPREQTRYKTGSKKWPLRTTGF